MNLLLLHLSDIHIKTANDPILKREKNIASCLYSFLPSASHIFFIVSGDVAFSGEDSQYTLATNFLKNIQKAIQKESQCPISFIIAPGNHDCNFEQDSGTRRTLIKSIDDPKTQQHDIDKSFISACTGIQASFFKFREDLEANKEVDDDYLWRSYRFTIEGQSIGFDCLNISWVSKCKEDPGYLYFPLNKYTDKKPGDFDIRFLVMHHPFNWFSQSIYRPFRVFTRKLANIIITGHEHQGNVGIMDDTDSGQSAFIEGWVLQDTEGSSSSSFNIAVIDLKRNMFKSTCYQWDGNHYAPAEEGSWSNYRDLPVKKSNLFNISEYFKDILDDPGAFFMHPGRGKLTLSDIFVYPDLKKVSDGKAPRRNLINSERLLSPDVTAKGILIEGEEKAGCTSLLHQIYRQYYDRGYVPLLLKGEQLKRTNETEIDTLIKREVGVQYGKDQIISFEQTPLREKLLLLDDFDAGPLRAASARMDVLCALRKRFGLLIVIVSEMFEIREIFNGNTPQELLTLVHYQLQRFGYARRGKLIERWYSLDKDGTIDEATFISRCDQAERLMNAVMTKTVIPSLPLFLLTLLQSMEAGRTGDFQDSALGYYYQYLLTEAFQASGVKPDKLTEVYQYAMHLAAEFHLQEKSELSEFELRNFNDKFSKEWHTVDLTSRIELLIRARVLCRCGDYYQFRYPYIYYYLKGKYLSANLDNKEIRSYIEHCCRHLYVRDHANTILFLVHHTNDDFVLNKIVESLHGLFPDCIPLTFKDDTAGVRKLIEDAPKLRYSTESPLQHRDRKRAIQDDLDDGHDGLADSEEKSDNLSLVAQIMMLFKTIEILGQILKNQYAKIQRTKKRSLIEQLFNGPLRALRDFYNYCEKNPDALVIEIERVIETLGKVNDEEARKKIARKVVASIVQLVTFSFILRAARGVNSDSLLEDVQDVVDKNDTLAFKVIDMFIHLDSPKDIPRKKLETLLIELEKKPVATRTITMMVVNRLYMFKTKETDMQWIREKIKIDINLQHAITYQEDKQRLNK